MMRQNHLKGLVPCHDVFYEYTSVAFGTTTTVVRGEVLTKIVCEWPSWSLTAEENSTVALCPSDSNGAGV